MEKNVRFMSDDGFRLCGILTVPCGKSKGAVIMAHGITANKDEGGSYLRLAKLLAKSHLASLRFDFRAHGLSGGRSQNVTISGEIKDLLAAMKYLKRKGHKKFAIIGTSFGAGIAVLCTRRKTSMITSLVLLCPVLDYKRTFLEPETEWAKKWFDERAISEAKRTGILDLDGFRLSNALLLEFGRHKPGETLLELNVPTMIAHGTRDRMVPYEVAQYYGSKRTNSRFIPVEGADHGLGAFEKKVFPDIVKWILKHIGRKA